MKKLDGFSRFEKRVWWFLKVLCYFMFFIFPFLCIYIFFGRELSSLTYFFLYMAFFIVGIILYFLVGYFIENIFAVVRRKRGLKSLDELEDEIDDERFAIELKREESEKRNFMGSDESEQRYQIYLLQQKQLKINADYIKLSTTHILIFWTITLTIAAIYFINKFIH